MTSDVNTEPTLRDLADEAGVSVAAVSKVLNNRKGVSTETRERVLRIARELGYRGRGGRLAEEKLTSAAIVTLDRYVTNDSFYGEIIHSIVREGQAAGINVSVSVTGSPEGAAHPDTLFPAGPPQAVFLVGIDEPAVVDAVHALGRPTVIVNGMDRHMRLPSVSPDYHLGGWRATRYLLDLGHRNIVHVTHPYRESFRRRVDGFRNAIEEAGITFDPQSHLLDLGSPEAISIRAREIVTNYLNSVDERPTAFFCVNDIVALGTIQALQANGLSVPEDVSVMGFDGLSVGEHASPSLTSMQIDRQEVGRAAIRQLQDRVVFPDRPAQRVSIGVDLLARKSTGPLVGAGAINN
ncbi:LacI family transcriptional regulator [Gilvimarinus agarilyticus]|uniref:LacI family DNA-binding transcriptional regulator n=1 Tax=unclassified Gilvimarinus TaxID=2642066 RepID=UPI001C0A386A|nr:MULTISPECIES: LacI family DNA-binding transcriptional regulator [unclassified Gilvimarinus]MBU2884459.1 LacI family transcriptional regulator [Gilvimarinus agarilyticus]MDO6569595.1 LacI family DNA-binding transcriptional regulator [Gilvimarinus sp. 2_MG-2023]MDO6748080.1 LacI family DNA-binding transcriptional regulator [Gilvimarinus sp. 1_MG-2023]